MATFRGLFVVSAVSVSLLGFSSAAQAADAHHNFAVRGIGAEQCSSFLQPAGKAEIYKNLSIENWVLGYITASNRMMPDTYDVMALQQPQIIPNLVVAMCKANPKASVEEVVNALIQRLEPIKIDSESPIVTTKNGNNEADIRKSTLALVEQGLAKQGDYHGKIDGIYGPDLQKSLVKFQKDQSLPQTGLPDSATIIRLLIELPTQGNSQKK